MRERETPLSPEVWKVFRIPIIFLIGMLANFTMEIILNLKFRNYPAFESVLIYIESGFIAWFIYVALQKVNHQLQFSAPWDRNPVRRFFIQAVTNIGLSVFIILFFRFVIALLSSATSYINTTVELVVFVVVALFALIFTIVDLSYFLVYRWRVSLAELEQFKKENLAFQFGMLKTQINPHFLFNSLNTLTGLIHSNTEVASEFVQKLSQLYRNLLQEKDNLHELSEELEFLKSYIYLISLRFGDNLRIIQNIETHLLQKKIAPMTLQMLMENAIKHNVISNKKPLQIIIKSENDGISVINNIQPKTEKEESTEIGLKNIKKRYEFLTQKVVSVEETAHEFKVFIPLL